MKRATIFFAALGLVFLFTSLCSAEPEIYKDRFYSDGHPPSPYDPTWTGATWNWVNPPYTHSFPRATNPKDTIPNPAVLNAGDSLLFGMENLHIPGAVKTLTLNITYTGATADLDWRAAAWGGYVDGDTTSFHTRTLSRVTVTKAAGSLKVVVIMPQPDWEWILIKNSGIGQATFTTVVLYSTCERAVPSLTQWGMIGLGVLILGAGAMVIVRRRRAVVQA